MDTKPVFPNLDSTSIRYLLSEGNSSKYALDAHHCGIQNIIDLSEVENLKSLDISFNEIKQISNLNKCEELKELKAYNNQLKSSKGIKCNTSIQVLILSNNHIKKISDDLLHLRQLKTLRMDGNLLESIENLKSCQQLTYLDLSRNRLTGTCIQGLEALTNLEYLNLSDNRFNKLGSMIALKKLEELNVTGNQLVSLDGLTGCRSLNVLKAGRNKIQDLEALPELDALNELFIECNLVNNLSPLLKKTPKLESLNIQNNRIRSIQEILILQDMSCLEDLWARGNPCTISQSFYIDVVKGLPKLLWLDDNETKKIIEQPDIVERKNGTQDRVRTALRPSTAGVRLATPNGRPITADGRPLFHQPSSRLANPCKLVSEKELSETFDTFRDRLTSLRETLNQLVEEKETRITIPEKEDVEKNFVPNPTDPEIHVVKESNPAGKYDNEVTMSMPSAIFSFIQEEKHSKDELIQVDFSKMTSNQTSISIEDEMKLKLNYNLESHNESNTSPRLEKNNVETRSVPNQQKRNGFTRFRVPPRNKKYQI